MARVANHLSVTDLEHRLRPCAQATKARHVQVIWLLAKGHTIADVAPTTAFGERWIEWLLARYHQQGPAALGDLRHQNGRCASVLLPDLLQRLRERLATPLSHGGLWTNPKGAA
jgi:hypothetical protein